jgi:hypothetical protein
MTLVILEDVRDGLVAFRGGAALEVPFDDDELV